MVKVNDALLKQIVEQLDQIQYGTLLVTVHNDEVTQLDVTRKQRFDRDANSQKPKKSKLKSII
jgi:hypothetical protein